jgi:hypothetical protein
MPWKGVALTEQRRRFPENYQPNYCSITDLTARFCIPRETACKCIKRFNQNSQDGDHKLSRRTPIFPCRTDKRIKEAARPEPETKPQTNTSRVLDPTDSKSPIDGNPSRALPQEKITEQPSRHTPSQG